MNRKACPGFRFTQSGLRRKKKGSGTPANASSHARTQAACGTRHERRAACAALRLRARSPAGVPLAVLASGTFVPRAQLRARLPDDDAKAAACRTLRPRSQRCTSRAGLNAGRHDARAARVRSVSFRPRAPHSPRRRGVPSLPAPFQERDSVTVLTEMGTRVNGNVTTFGPSQ